MCIIVFLLHLAYPLKCLRWTVMSQAVLSFRLRGSFGEITFQPRVYSTCLCERLSLKNALHPISLILVLCCQSHHALNVESQLLFPPKIGQADIKISKSVLKKTKLGFYMQVSKQSVTACKTTVTFYVHMKSYIEQYRNTLLVEV